MHTYIHTCIEIYTHVARFDNFKNQKYKFDGNLFSSEFLNS